MSAAVYMPSSAMVLAHVISQMTKSQTGEGVYSCMPKSTMVILHATSKMSNSQAGYALKGENRYAKRLKTKTEPV